MSIREECWTCRLFRLDDECPDIESNPERSA